MKLLFALLIVMLAAHPAWAGHEELGSQSPLGIEWFCAPEVALYMHPFLPARAIVFKKWQSQDKEYVSLYLYAETPDIPLAETIHEVSEGQLGQILFFKTLPDGRILCNKL